MSELLVHVYWNTTRSVHVLKLLFKKRPTFLDVDQIQLLLQLNVYTT